MILSKVPCPDCSGSGIAPQRGGLCPQCHGEGKRRPTLEEERLASERSLKCACQGGTARCNGGCGTYGFI